MRGVSVCTSAVVLALTVVAPGNSAPGEQDGAAPAAERRGPCQTINLGGVKIFYKSRMSCEKAKHYARRLYKTGGRDEPRNFTCESGTNYETGANCYHDHVGARRFGWFPGDKRKAKQPKVLCWNKSAPDQGPAQIRSTPRKCSLFRDGYDFEAAGAVHLRKLDWKNWGGRTTVAKGEYAEPMDFDDPWKPIQVRLKKPIEDCGRVAYSKAIFHVPGGPRGRGFPIWTC